MNDVISFERNIEIDIDERKIVLSEIERALFTQRYNLSRKHYDILSIQSISMIYSIWEGFVQKSLNEYIDFINNSNILKHDLSDELYVHHVESSFKQFREYPDKYNRKVTFLRNLNQFFNESITKLNISVDTKSNVGFEVLNSLLKIFCIEQFQEHWRNYTHPNPTLKETMFYFLKYRNGVAHGGDISSEEKVTQQIFSKYRNLVVDLMCEIQLRMIESLKNQKYIKSKVLN